MSTVQYKLNTSIQKLTGARNEEANIWAENVGINLMNRIPTQSSNMNLIRN